MAWLNGRCIGRYWLAPGTGKPEEWLLQAVYQEGEGLPTQRYYHLPSEWLVEQNVLVLFEEGRRRPHAGEIVPQDIRRDLR